MKKILLLALVTVGFINCTAERVNEVYTDIPETEVLEASSSKSNLDLNIGGGESWNLTWDGATEYTHDNAGNIETVKRVYYPPMRIEDFSVVIVTFKLDEFANPVEGAITLSKNTGISQFKITGPFENSSTGIHFNGKATTVDNSLTPGYVIGETVQLSFTLFLDDNSGKNGINLFALVGEDIIFNSNQPIKTEVKEDHTVFTFVNGQNDEGGTFDKVMFVTVFDLPLGKDIGWVNTYDNVKFELVEGKPEITGGGSNPHNYYVRDGVSDVVHHSTGIPYLLYEGDMVIDNSKTVENAKIQLVYRDDKQKANSSKDPSFTAFTNKYNYIQEIDALLPDKKHTVYYGCTTYTEGDNWRNWKFKATTGDYFELHIQPGKSKLEWKYHDGGNWGHPLSDDAYAYAGDGQYLLIENFALLGWEGDSYWEGKYFNLWLGSVPADGCNWSLN